MNQEKSAACENFMKREFFIMRLKKSQYHKGIVVNSKLYSLLCAEKSN